MQQLAQLEGNGAPRTAKTEAESAVARSKTVDFASEYYYVYADLRNVTLVVTAMFALMFALGFFI